MVLTLETFILVLLENDTENNGKKIAQLKDIEQNYYCSNYYNVSVNKYGKTLGK